METIVVVGVETVAGANLAASLCDRMRVVGVCLDDRPVLLDPAVTCYDRTAGDPEDVLRRESPSVVLHCGPASVGLWETLDRGTLSLFNDRHALRWASAAAMSRIPFVLISSCGVFSGPWMFHSERSECWCASAEATAIRQTEHAVRGRHPEALIVRTHVIGWSPRQPGAECGWFEKVLATLADGQAMEIPATSHSTPIAAGAFADLLEVVLQRRPRGVLHLGGAQRVNFQEFAETASEVFGLPRPPAGRRIELASRPEGFGRGETSLQADRLRRWGLTVPLLRDSLVSLRHQQDSGFVQRLGHVELSERVA
ncbi:MAG: hypothetical protein D6725_14025 [Planctomycetota bacterium]|nr:MAG: hypothetical protein D6725_14025 [Planctomycetota bacterium]